MYGFPFKPGKQVQEAALFWARHCALRPQGEGLQGSIISGRGEVAKIIIMLCVVPFYSFILLVWK